jgi:hypothetical protein
MGARIVAWFRDRPLLLAGPLVALWAAACLANLSFPSGFRLGFTGPWARNGWTLAVLALPAFAFLLAFQVPRPRLRIASIALIAPLVLISFAVAFFDVATWWVGPTSRDDTFERIAQIRSSAGRQRVVAYRADADGWSSSVVIREERKIAPGLVLARTVFDQRKAYEATFQRTDARHVRALVATAHGQVEVPGIELVE